MSNAPSWGIASEAIGAAAANAALIVDLQWACSVVEACPAEDDIKRWAQAAIINDSSAHYIEGSAGEVTIRIVDGPEMQSTNARWRGQDKKTNVLSFPADFPPETGLKYYGDMMVCAEVIQAESVQQEKLPQAHWAHIVVHGMLHLQGYDHIEDAAATEMEQCEVTILRKLGFPNPYQSDSHIAGLGNITEVEKS